MEKSAKSVLAVLLASVFLFSGCVGNDAKDSENNQSIVSSDVEKEDEINDSSPVENNNVNEDIQGKKVGILQTVEHPALDDSRDGFIAALAANGYVNGDNLVIDIQNGQGDQSNLKSISQKFVGDKCDLILAIATPAAQSIAAETKEIPIVITAVTDPAEAKLVVSNEDTQTNVTGTSDMAPYKEQLDLMMELVPDMKSLAIMYNSSEPNSVIQANLVEDYATKTLGLRVEHKTISTTNDIDQVAQSVVGKFDAIYAPTDNTIASAMPTLANVALTNKLPIICAEEGMVTGGGLASVSINYYELGYKSGEMAVKILNGESTPQDMPIEYAPKPTLIFNAAMFKAIGLEIPESLKDSAKIVNE